MSGSELHPRPATHSSRPPNPYTSSSANRPAPSEPASSCRSCCRLQVRPRRDGNVLTSRRRRRRTRQRRRCLHRAVIAEGPPYRVVQTRCTVPTHQLVRGFVQVFMVRFDVGFGSAGRSPGCLAAGLTVRLALILDVIEFARDSRAFNTWLAPWIGLAFDPLARKTAGVAAPTASVGLAPVCCWMAE